MNRREFLLWPALGSEYPNDPPGRPAEAFKVNGYHVQSKYFKPARGKSAGRAVPSNSTSTTRWARAPAKLHHHPRT